MASTTDNSKESCGIDKESIIPSVPQFLRSRKAGAEPGQSARVLASQVNDHNEWAIMSGYKIRDAQTWRSLCEKLKFSADSKNCEQLLDLFVDTIEIARHCDGHPIALINYAREELGIPRWDKTALDQVVNRLLCWEAEHGPLNGKDYFGEDAVESASDDEKPSSPGSKKRKGSPVADLERFAHDVIDPVPSAAVPASQPYDESDF